MVSSKLYLLLATRVWAQKIGNSLLNISYIIKVKLLIQASIRLKIAKTVFDPLAQHHFDKLILPISWFLPECCGPEIGPPKWRRWYPPGLSPCSLIYVSIKVAGSIADLPNIASCPPYPSLVSFPTLVISPTLNPLVQPHFSRICTNIAGWSTNAVSSPSSPQKPLSMEAFKLMNSYESYDSLLCPVNYESNKLSIVEI